MRLITAHRILIGAGIAFFLFYAGWRLRRYGASGSPGDIAQAVVSAAVALGLIVYYRSLRGWGRPPS
ncbi:MAG: hypothetical protein HY614_01035 [Candidatus Rokubacteria bacterium]|nr:hypothetical protein [Candidatus Rokubacteria bacterium]